MYASVVESVRSAHSSRAASCLVNPLRKARSPAAAYVQSLRHRFIRATRIKRIYVVEDLGPDYKKILRLSYDVIITYDNRKSNLR